MQYRARDGGGGLGPNYGVRRLDAALGGASPRAGRKAKRRGIALCLPSRARRSTTIQSLGVAVVGVVGMGFVGVQAKAAILAALQRAPDDLFGFDGLRAPPKWKR